VFCYADGAVFRDGERFIELIEVCYFDYSNRLPEHGAQYTTCPCSACAAIGSLDLKFVCHYGSFVIDTEAGGVDLAGPDVILVHRLLKNTVSESTGIKAYALLTDPCLQQLPQTLRPATPRGAYESFGVNNVWGTRPQAGDRRHAGCSPALHRSRGRRSCVSVEVPIPPVAAWKYWLDPIERQRWACRHFSKKPDWATRNAQGRIGPGAAMHCNHGPGTARWEFVDWRPFASVTHEVTAPRLGHYLGLRDEFDTFDFMPTPDGGTPVVHRVRLKTGAGCPGSRIEFSAKWIGAYWHRAPTETWLSIISEDNAVGQRGDTGRIQHKAPTH